MHDTLFSVTDQIVLVSGGSRGIGKAIAHGFAARGATVIVTGCDESTLLAAANEDPKSPLTPIVCDVGNRQSIERLVDQVKSQYSRVDTLINVAGVNRRKPALEITEDDYDYVLDINLKGAFLLSQAIGRRMIAHGGGCIINIESLNVDRPLKSVTPYAMSKAALAQMTKALALEWGELGVRVNGLAPGFILTDLTNKLWSDQTMHDWGVANTPQRRLGKPEDLVGTAIFLASPAAAFLTGQTIFVDGGFTAGWEWPIPADNQ